MSILAVLTLYSLGVSVYCYYQLCLVREAALSLASKCMISHAVEAKNTVDILVANNVSHEVVNIFKKKYLCLTSELHPEVAQELDSTPVKISAE